MGGCVASRPNRTRPITTLKSLAIRTILWLRARLTEILSWLKTHLPFRPVRTYPTLSEPCPHISVEVPPPAKYPCEDQIDRYDWAYAEMSLPKSERMRRQSALERPTLRGAGNIWPDDAGYTGGSVGLDGDPFLFL